MARVLIATQSWGVVQDHQGAVRAGVTVQLTALDGNPAEVFTAEGEADPQALITNSRGEIPGWVEAESYNLTISGITRRVEAVSGVPLGAPVWNSDVRGRADGWLYNTNEVTLRRIRAALGKTGETRAHIAAFGDSITLGSAADAPLYQTSYMGRLHAMLERETGSAGTGIVYPMHIEVTNDPRFTVTGAGWSETGERGLYGRSKVANGTGNTIAYGPVVCDEFVIYYVKESAGGTFNASVDGGSATAVDSNDATEQFATAVISTPGSTLPRAHTLTITAPASGTVRVLGIEARTGTTGVRVTRGGHGGQSAEGLITDASNTSSLKTAFEMDPADLVIIALGTNDYGNGISTAAEYKANMGIAIDAAQAAESDVLLIVEPVIGTPIGTPLGTASAYVDALYELADEKDVAILDLQQRWGTDHAALLANGLMEDDYHPSQAGHWDMAHALFELLAPPLTGVNTPVLAAANTWVGSGTIFQSVDINNPTLIVRGDNLAGVGQYAGDLIQFRDAGDTVYARIGARGNVHIDSSQALARSQLLVSPSMNIVVSDGAHAMAAVHNGGVDAVNLALRATSGQTRDLLRFEDNDTNVLSSINENGYYMTRKTSAPADGELSNGEGALWWDATPGTGGWRYKGKASDGSILSGSL